MLTKAAIEALEVVYDPATAKEQTLQLPDVSSNSPQRLFTQLMISYQNQIPGCDVLGIKFYYEDTTKSDKFVGFKF